MPNSGISTLLYGICPLKVAIRRFKLMSRNEVEPNRAGQTGCEDIVY